MQLASTLVQQAVILAAGNSSRFEPFTSRNTHKSSFQVLGRSVLSHCISKLESLGINSLLVVHNPADSEILQLQQHFSSANINLRFVPQPAAIGQYDALIRCRPYLEDSFLITYPEHLVSFDSLVQATNTQIRQIPSNSLILYIGQTKHPERYGVVTRDKSRLVSVVEKPSTWSEHPAWKRHGIMLANKSFIDQLEKYTYESYPNIAAMNFFAQHKQALVVELDHTCTYKYAWDLFTIQDYLLKTMQATIAEDAKIHPSVQIEGAVSIASGVEIHANTVIAGPCSIGENSRIMSFCHLRPHVSIGKQVIVGSYSEVKASILDDAVHVHRSYLGNSILGRDVRVGAGFVSANRRLDRSEIRVNVQANATNSGMDYLGCFIGDHSRIGMQCGTNPGRVIPANSYIHPGSII